MTRKHPKIRSLPGRLFPIRRLAGWAAVAALVAGACVPDAPGGEDSVTGPVDGELSVTLAWDPPSEDEQGYDLDDLEGFRLYHGTEELLRPENAEVIELGAETRHTLRGLEPGVHYFAVTALDSNGNESEMSEVLSVRVEEP